MIKVFLILSIHLLWNFKLYIVVVFDMFNLNSEILYFLMFSSSLMFSLYFVFCYVDCFLFLEIRIIF